MELNRRKLTPNENAILYAEVEEMCPICSKALMYEKSGKKYKRYEGAHIYPLNPSKEEEDLLKNEFRIHVDVNHISNFIALCNGCHTEFDNPRTLEEYKKLLSIKKNILSRQKIRANYVDFQIDKEIKEVIIALASDYDEDNLTQLDFNAMKVNEKANDSLTKITKRKIRNDVSEYYLSIKENFRQLDSQYPDFFARVAVQVKSFYLTLKKTEQSQEVIYSQLTEWLSRKTGNTSSGACAIIISFFIQNCEVF
ncbi:HNH endonuclease [Bacillus sp. C1-1]|nr:HNH endonuclease [Bacillus sp. C1-1]